MRRPAATAQLVTAQPSKPVSASRAMIDNVTVDPTDGTGGEWPPDAGP